MLDVCVMSEVHTRFKVWKSVEEGVMSQMYAWCLCDLSNLSVMSNRESCFAASHVWLDHVAPVIHVFCMCHVSNASHVSRSCVTCIVAKHSIVTALPATKRETERERD